MSSEHAPERQRTTIRTKTTQRLAYRPTEVAEMLGISLRKVNDLIASGKLESTKVDRCRRITPKQIAALLAGEAA